MRIIQISDSHIELATPSRLTDLKTCIDEVNAHNPDIVIHTGDISHNNLIDEYRAAHDILDTLNTPYYITGGNKDTRQSIRDVFADHEYLKQHDTFLQYSIEQFSTRLIMLDTVKEGTSKGELCEQRMAHLQTMLEADNTKPVIIFMHHSPYVVEEIPDPWQFHNWKQVEDLGRLLSKYRNVQQIYCGHVHRNVAGVLGGLTVDVLSCIATDLRKGELSEVERNRAMFRVIDL